MPATIHDVAAAAGVSPTTVSHALNNKGRVNAETRQRIVEAAKHLGYTANPLARGLVTGRSQTLAMQIAGFGRETFVPNSAYFTELLNAACAAALECGYVSLLVPSSVEVLLERLEVDGALIVDPTGEEELIKLMETRQAPVVTTGRVPSLDPESSYWVDNDHVWAAERALGHLDDRGYRRPALLTTASESYSIDAQRAYRRWMDARDGTARIGEIRDDFTVEQAAMVAARLLAETPRPDAIYATNDTSALAALRAVRAAGLKAPEDVGIVAEMDTEALRVSDPPITAIDVYPARLGRSAVALLVDLIEDREPAAPHVVVETDLVIRASTAGKADAPVAFGQTR